MKTESLTIRLDSKLRDEIEIMAMENHKKISLYVREILEKETLSNKVNESENIFNHNFKNLTESDFFNSNEFLYLYSWIMDKMLNPYSNKSIESKNTIDKIKQTIYFTISNNCISDNVKQEFEKILQDVLKYDNDSEYLKSFSFNKSGNHSTVNFQTIINFISQYSINRF